MKPTLDEFKEPAKIDVNKAFSRYIKDVIKDKRSNMTAGDLELIISLCQVELNKRRCV